MEFSTNNNGGVLSFTAADMYVGQVIPVKDYGVTSYVHAAVLMGQVDESTAWVMWRDGERLVIQEAQVHISSVSKPRGNVFKPTTISDPYNVCRLVYKEANGDILSDTDGQSRRIWQAREMVDIKVDEGHNFSIEPKVNTKELAIDEMVKRHKVDKDIVAAIFEAGVRHQKNVFSGELRELLQPKEGMFRG